MSTTEPCAADLLHAGDAFLARDPLSSQGLSAAVADGQATAIAAHTLLSDPGAARLVADFFGQRLRRARQEHGDFLGVSYAGAARSTAFWQARAQAQAPESRSASGFRASARFVLSPSWELRPSAVLTEDRIVEAQCLCAKNGKDAIGWLGGVAIGHWVAVLSAPQDEAQIFSEWRRLGLGTEARLGQVLRHLCDQGMVVPGE